MMEPKDITMKQQVITPCHREAGKSNRNRIQITTIDRKSEDTESTVVLFSELPNLNRDQVNTPWHLEADKIN